MWVLALIVGLPLLEIALFVTVGGWLGLWATLAIVLLTAVLGVMILQRRGMVMQGLSRKVPDPMVLMADGGLLMVAGILLILPGFFTDSVGLLLLIPPVRAAILAQVKARIGARIGASTVVFRRGGFSKDDVIDGDFIEVPKETSGLTPPSKWTEH